jgi:hypothetical protein
MQEMIVYHNLKMSKIAKIKKKEESLTTDRDLNHYRAKSAL